MPGTENLFEQVLDTLARETGHVALSGTNAGFIEVLMRGPAGAAVAEPAPLAPPTPPPSRRPTPPPSPTPPAAPQTLPDLGQMDLAEIEALVSTCRRCPLCEGRTRTVFGAGNPRADLMFIGEGPGADEDRQGIPFVGAAGQLLDRIIGAMQLSRDDVYIANIVKCRPPNNRNPEADEALCCLPYLRRQIELIQPKVIVLLGNVPMTYLLGKRGIMRARGNWYSYEGIDVMPTYHPAYLLHRREAPEEKRKVWEDMQKVMLKLGLDPAQSRKQQ